MKRFKTKWNSVATKLLFSLFALLSLHPSAYAGEGIISNTKEMEKENIRKVKESGEALLNSVKEFKEGIQDTWKDATNSLSSSGNVMDNIIAKVDEAMSGDLKQLKNLNFDDVKSSIEELKKGIDDTKSGAKELKDLLTKMQSQAETLIYNVKNIVTLRYTMPVGFRSSKLMLDLGVDELRYVRDLDKSGNVAMDIHATWTLPWTVAEGDGTTLPFEGKNIVIRGEGSSKIKVGDGNSEAKLQYWTLTLTKDKIYLDVDTASYLEIDCNGFKSMYLKGRVRFASDLMTPVNTTDTAVTASFAASFTNLHDMLFEAQIDHPFKVKATDDVIYTGYGLVADFSTQRNGSNFEFPKCYDSPFEPGDENFWTGFAIKKLAVDLTQEFDDFPLDSISAYNMLIDETGVSGYFSASMSVGKSNQKASTQSAIASGNNPNSKSNSTIEAEFKDITLGLAHGKIREGSVHGSITIKPLEDSKGQPLELGLIGSIQHNSQTKHLSFSIETRIEKDLTYELPFLKTTNVTIGQGTSISYEKYYDSVMVDDQKVEQAKRVFTLNLNGGLDVKNKLLEVNGLKFEGLQFSSAKPHFKNGTFSLNSVGVPSLHGLPFGLKNVGARNSGEDAVLTPEVYLSLIGKESNEDSKQGVSVDAAFDLVAGIDDTKEFKWKLKGLKLKKIDVDVSYSAFRLKGGITGFDDDPMYGDGFDGNILFSMKTPPIEAEARAFFGKTNYIDGKSVTSNKYRYWYVYANVNMPPATVIFPPAVLLNSVSLSLYNKIDYDYDPVACKISNIYPNKKNGFGFKAGVGFCVAQDNLINAKVTMGLDFSGSGGISNVNLNGHVGVLSKEDMEKCFLEGTIGVKYDFQNEILALDAKVTPGQFLKDKKILDGVAKIKLRTYPESWYCNIGSIQEPNYLKFCGIAEAKSYVMFGDSVPTYLPPMDPAISALFNADQSTATSSDHSEEMSDGTGFAFGIALSVDAHLNAFVYADLVFKGGTDLLVVRKPRMQCGDSKYRASGQVYVYLAGAAGIKFRKKKFEVVGFSAAASLEGEIPKPIYIQGRVAFEYRLLGGMLSGHARAKYKTGSTCSWAPDGTPIYEQYDGVILDEEELDAPDEPEE